MRSEAEGSGVSGWIYRPIRRDLAGRISSATISGSPMTRPGPEHCVLLLRPADEQHPLGPAGRLETGQVLVHHVVLALPPGEVDPGDVMRVSEGPQPRDEAPAHRRDHRRGGNRLPHVPADEPHDPLW